MVIEIVALIALLVVTAAARCAFENGPSGAVRRHRRANDFVSSLAIMATHDPARGTQAAGKGYHEQRSNDRPYFTRSGLRLMIAPPVTTY